MADEQWLEIAGRLAPRAPTDLDSRLERPRHRGPGGWLARGTPVAACAPASRIWADQLGERACIGVRVTGPLKNIAWVGARLLSIAAERGVNPIIFSTMDNCGLERFGFRVERLSGASEQDVLACEEELRSFWNITIVIDAAQIADLG